jgi:ribosomal protein S18 acetylase RimI-like enzyme
MMHIRHATDGDTTNLLRLVNSAYRGEGGWTGESHLIAGPRTRTEDIEELLHDPDAAMLVAWEEGEMMGCVYLKRQDGNLYLGMLSVWPAKQGAGVGKYLMKAAEEYASLHQCRKIRITVISVREELIAWYERHGFRRTGEAEPFHAGDRFGTQKQPLELAVLEKKLPDHPPENIGRTP